MKTLALCLCLGALIHAAAGSQCSAPPRTQNKYDYSNVFSDEANLGIKFNDLPGFTRSVYARDYALITPESRVWAGHPTWKHATTSHLISRASGANFAMYLVNMQDEAEGGSPQAGVERFILVVEGEVTVQTADGKVELATGDYAYFPANYSHTLTSDEGAGLVVYERVYALSSKTQFLHGSVDEQPVLPSGGAEVFVLRKMLPQTEEYDFNIHVMDFKPGEHLMVKEIHYNQHGLLLLQGKGIYRLGNDWYPVQAGDAIWMAPYVPQWYAALGYHNTRYVIYKDTTVDPLFG